MEAGFQLAAPELLLVEPGIRGSAREELRVRAGLDNSPAVPELPSSFAAQSPDAGLQAAIESALAGREGSYSVVVHNLADGRAASLNADKSYYAASLYKLEVLLELDRHIKLGETEPEPSLEVAVVRLCTRLGEAA